MKIHFVKKKKLKKTDSYVYISGNERKVVWNSKVINEVKIEDFYCCSSCIRWFFTKVKDYYVLIHIAYSNNANYGPLTGSEWLTVSLT